MKNTLSIVVLVLIVSGLIYYFGFYNKEGLEESQLPNPASVLCQEQNGTIENKEFLGGVRGFCLFSDGSECGQWDLFYGDCQKGELKKETLIEGEGVRANVDDMVSVHYVGTLENGSKFDSSRDKGEPFSFVLGAGRVIAGWEQGVLGMKVGETRKLTIGPRLGYGEQGIGPIPPNSVLIFEVELLEIK